MQETLDNRVFVSLPEGVSVEMTPAGIAVRSCAYMVDFALRAVIIVLGAAGLAWTGVSGIGLLLVLSFVISWGYYIILEAQSGQTPGKRLFRLMVVDDGGLPVSVSGAILRNLIRPIDSFPFAYVSGLLCMSLNPDFKRLGDWAAGTRVVYLEPDTRLKKPSDGDIRVPPVQLSTEEQRTLMLFADRAQTLSAARCQELAQIIMPVFNLTEEDAIEQLQEIARYYAGRTV